MLRLLKCIRPVRSSLSSRIRPLRMYTSDEARSFIEKTVKENDVVVFMKGTPRAPQCGFSRTVCKILEYQGLPTFATVNILEDADLRSEIKEYTSWPTIPQVFIKGQFIGGCDIMLDMNQSGQLRELLQKEGILEKEASSEDKSK